MHDAFLINVPNDPEAIAVVRKQIAVASEEAVHQLFPGLAVKCEIEILNRFAKDGKEDSLNLLLASLENEGALCPVG